MSGNNFFLQYFLVNLNDHAYGERQESAHEYDSSANVYDCANEKAYCQMRSPIDRNDYVHGVYHANAHAHAPLHHAYEHGNDAQIDEAKCQRPSNPQPVLIAKL